MLVPWLIGFVTYQLINPGYISWWVLAWQRIDRLVGFRAASWMSASICSFVIAAAATLLGGAVTNIVRKRRARRRLAEPETSGDDS
jgi:NCS1 family nucleobase:cation symporter-1